MKELPKAAATPSLLWRIAKFFFPACILGGFGGGLIGVIFVVIAATMDPNSVRMGGGNDPAGVAILFFLACGFVGLLFGMGVGIIGAIVIALRR